MKKCKEVVLRFDEDTYESDISFECAWRHKALIDQYNAVATWACELVAELTRIQHDLGRLEKDYHLKIEVVKTEKGGDDDS